MLLFICALLFAVATADDYDGGRKVYGYGRSYSVSPYTVGYGTGNLGYGLGNQGYGYPGGYGGYGTGNLGYGLGNQGYGYHGGYGMPDVAYFGGNTYGNQLYGRISTPYGLNLNYGGSLPGLYGLGSGTLGYGGLGSGLGGYGYPGYGGLVSGTLGYGGLGSGLGGYGYPGYGSFGYGTGRPDVAYFNGNTHGNRVYGSISTPYGLNIPYGNTVGLGFSPYGSGYGYNSYGNLGGGYGVNPYLVGGGYGTPSLYNSYVTTGYRTRGYRRKRKY